MILPITEATPKPPARTPKATKNPALSSSISHSLVIF